MHAELLCGLEQLVEFALTRVIRISGLDEFNLATVNTFGSDRVNLQVTNTRWYPFSVFGIS